MNDNIEQAVAPEIEQKIVWVLDYNVDAALAELEKLAAKARRYGNKDITVAKGESRDDYAYYTDWEGNERRVKVIKVALVITGEAPRIGNHEFLARIELHEGGNLIDTRPGVEDLDHRFRNADGTCEHCNRKRKRNEVYVVRDIDANTQRAIGRNCLRDYLGIDDPGKIANRFGFFRSVGDFEDEWGPRGKLQWKESLLSLLTLGAVCIRLFGWCSGGQARFDDSLTPTSSYVHRVINENRFTDKEDRALIARIKAEVNDGDRETAEAVIKYVREEMTGDSDYVHNLKVLFSADCIYSEKRVGIVISAIASYHKAKEIELRKTKEREAAKLSVHVGTVGQRLRGMKVTLMMQRVIGSNDFGESILIKFADADSNILTWITGKGCKAEIGEQLELDGTVKAHKTFNGIEETNLTRCKVYAIDKEKAA